MTVLLVIAGLGVLALGLILAIATESLIKLVAFVTVGVFVTFIMFDGPMDLFAKAMDTPRTAAVHVSNILAIANKELRSYFSSPIAYIIIGFFLLPFGVFFYLYLTSFVRASMQQAQMGGAMNINQNVIRYVLQNASVIILFIMPMITMRTYAEEKRSGTIELLLTAPLTDLQIVLGKFLGALGLGHSLLFMPFQLYVTFVIEERFGFNRTTLATFAKDLLKGALLAIALGAPVLSLLPDGARKVIFFVPEAARPALATGSTVSLACDGCPESLAAEITFLGREAEFTPPVIFSRENRGKLMFRAEAKLSGEAAGLPLGQPVDVTPALRGSQ